MVKIYQVLKKCQQFFLNIKDIQGVPTFKGFRDPDLEYFEFIDKVVISMNREYIENWLSKLKVYWFNKDIVSATSLFWETTFYQETPFLKPYTTFDEIVEEWQHIKKEDIKKIEFNILAIESYTVIVHWYLEQNNDIYEIRFNNSLSCIYFKSWEMKKEKVSGE